MYEALWNIVESIEDFYRKKVCQHLWRWNNADATDRKEGLPVSVVRGREKS
jgi:hypothetical protein